jgi:hypothetical protein
MQTIAAKIRRMTSQLHGPHGNRVQHDRSSYAQGFCTDCGRMHCKHSAARGLDERFLQLVELEPVETTSGEYARRLALDVLGKQHAQLEQRSRTEFRFSEIERQHMQALAAQIASLEGMAPRGELRPPRGSLPLEPAIL